MGPKPQRRGHSVPLDLPPFGGHFVEDLFEAFSLSASKGRETDATLAHRMGEGLGVRASGEVSIFLGLAPSRISLLLIAGELMDDGQKKSELRTPLRLTTARQVDPVEVGWSPMASAAAALWRDKSARGGGGVLPMVTNTYQCLLYHTRSVGTARRPAALRHIKNI